MASFSLGFAKRSTTSGLLLVFCSCLAGLYVAGRLWNTSRQLYYLVSRINPPGSILDPASQHSSQL